MAPREHWVLDPWNQREVWTRLVGQDHEDHDETRKQICEIIGPRTGVRCLEIGAGVGRLLKETSKSFYEAVGVDSSPTMVALSTRYLFVHPHCKVILTDGMSLPFATGSCDFVYSFTCFQHMEELATIRSNLFEAHRVLRPGKEILIQTVCGPRDQGLHDGYVFPQIQDFADEFHVAGFETIAVELKGQWLWGTARKP